MKNSVSSQQVQPTQQCDTDQLVQQQDIGSVECDDRTRSVHHVVHESDVNSKKKKVKQAVDSSFIHDNEQ